VDSAGSLMVNDREKLSSIKRFRRSFWDGWLDLFIDSSSLDRIRFARSPEEAARMDAEAIASDWDVVGSDLRAAMRSEKEHQTSLAQSK
jgi:predicted NAD-dependent protein-ADP-ribosyltransferase YbiA (DUF1768 family)